MSTAALPEPKELRPEFSANGDALYEVVNGQYVELPPMSALANYLSSRLHVRLANFVDANPLGHAVSEMVFVLDPEVDLRRRPDVAFVSKERWPLDRILPESGDWMVIPDVAVEVISPNDAFESVFGKIDEYFDHGVRQVWVVLPGKKEVFIFTAPREFRKLSVGQELDGGDTIPGFRLSLTELFKQPVSAGA